MKTAAKRAPGVDTAPTWNNIGAKLAAKGVSKDDFALMSATNLEPSKHARYCDVMISLYRAVTGLPSAEAATALRDLFSGKS